MSDDLRQAGEETVRPSDALEERCSDLGNARRFARFLGIDLRYVHAWGRWLVWDETRWAADLTGEVERRGKLVVESIATEAALETNPDRRHALLKHALVSEGARAIRNMIDLARSERGIAVPPDVFDRDPFLLNVANGTLDLRTGALRPHQRADGITKLAPIVYDPAAACPTFDDFLVRILGGRRSMIDYIQRLVGYTLTGDVREQCFFLLHGPGANGKSTLMQTIADLLADYAATVAPETLLAHKHDAGLILNDLSTLQGARYVVAVESDMGRRLAEGLVKQITGGETLKVKKLYSDVYAITPTFKLWIGTNHAPTIRGTDHAMWRRVRRIPFDVVIPDEEQDLQFGAKLHAERPGILRWAVEGCLAWQRQGLGTPDEVKRATAAYRGDMDVLGDFFADRCVVEPAARVSVGGLYLSYTDWAKQTGETPLTQRALAGALAERGFVARRTKRERLWVGLRLLGPLDEGDASERVTQSDALSYKVPTRAREEVLPKRRHFASPDADASPDAGQTGVPGPMQSCSKHPVTRRPECSTCQGQA